MLDTVQSVLVFRVVDEGLGRSQESLTVHDLQKIGKVRRESGRDCQDYDPTPQRPSDLPSTSTLSLTFVCTGWLHIGDTLRRDTAAVQMRGARSVPAFVPTERPHHRIMDQHYGMLDMGSDGCRLGRCALQLDAVLA